MRPGDDLHQARFVGGGSFGDSPIGERKQTNREQNCGNSGCANPSWIFKYQNDACPFFKCVTLYGSVLMDIPRTPVNQHKAVIRIADFVSWPPMENNNQYAREQYWQ